MKQMHFVEAPNNFYLGAQVDPDTHEVIDDAPVYYDARDLTTHGVILGMTGSGKTGLAVTLLEEATLDGIPCIVLDPKGDITNMLLAFPDLTPEHFQPWINPDDALRNDHSPEEHAQAVAEKWREGLERWGITNDRVQQFRHAARFSIYTPGSEAGLPVSILQSLAAVGNGGVWGVGLMEGVQKRFWLPEAHSDFIFAVIAEELGLIGAVITLAAFAVLAWRGLSIAADAPDRFGAFLALGLTTLIGFQALLNISVVIGLLPTKGIPLPLVSAGGSSMLVSFLALGVLLNLSTHASVRR